MNILTLALLTVQVMPSLPRYIGVASSMAFGTVLASLLVLACYLINWTASTRSHIRRGGHVDMAFIVLLLVMALGVLPHAAVADVLHPVQFVRLVESFVSLVLMLAGAIALGGILCRAMDVQVERAINMSVAVLCAVMVLRLVGLEPLAGRFERPMFPFSEPSHFALAFIPVLLYRCASARGRAALGWLIFGVVAGLLLKSLTVLLGCILAAMVCRRLIMMSTMGLVLALGLIPLDLAYFVGRLRFADQSSNLSGLVYLQGWQLIGESLATSSGWGLGFEQLGLDGTLVPAASVIYALAGQNLNLQDGGFVLAKLASEFGVIGAIGGILYCLMALLALRALRRGETRAVTRFAYCVVLAYTVDLFARGPGYFSGSSLLMVAALSVLATNAELTAKVVTALREVVVADLRRPCRR